MDYAESVATTAAPVARPSKRAPRDEVPQHQQWIDTELLAWGRWTRTRSDAVRCGSAEGQYRAPWRQWHYPSVEELMPKPLDGWIWKVERAVNAQTDPYRSALVLHYARMCNAFVTCRRLRIRYEQYAAVLSTARQSVEALLR